MELFRAYYARRKGEFVIESDSTPPPFDAPYGVYRWQDHGPQTQADKAAGRTARRGTLQDLQ